MEITTPEGAVPGEKTFCDHYTYIPYWILKIRAHSRKQTLLHSSTVDKKWIFFTSISFLIIIIWSWHGLIACAKFNVMKIQALLILIALSLSILSSLYVSPPRHVRRTDDHSHFITLDECNPSGSAVSVSADTPALVESFCSLLPLEFSGYTKVVYPQYKSTLIAFQLKHPPRS